MAYTPETVKVVMWSLLVVDGSNNSARVAGVSEHPFALAPAHIPDWPSLSWTIDIDPEGMLISIGTYDSAKSLAYQMHRHETEIEVDIFTPGDS